MGASGDLIYLDNAATTALHPDVLAAMASALATTYGNPANSSHALGRAATHAIDVAREQVAQLIGAASEQVYFTSGATEANNLAIRGIASSTSAAGRDTIIVSAIEHRSILCPVDELAQSRTVTIRTPVNVDGVIDLEALEQLLDERTLLVCVHLANNEIGTIQPLAQVARLAHDVGALVLCDATQAIGKIDVDVDVLGVDLLSLSAHKFNGPKGAGALYVAPGVTVAPQVTGGGQECGLRAGTPNVPAIIGMGVAAQLASRHVGDGVIDAMHARRDRLEQALLEQCPGAIINGGEAPRLASITSITFRGGCGAALVAAMPELAISRGSACSTGAPTPSHVLAAIGRSADDSFATLRLSLGIGTSDADIERAIDIFARGVAAAVG